MPRGERCVADRWRYEAAKRVGNPWQGSRNALKCSGKNNRDGAICMHVYCRWVHSVQQDDRDRMGCTLIRFTVARHSLDVEKCRCR